MQLADDVLGLFFFIAPELTDARVILWNWKTGRLLYVCYFHPVAGFHLTLYVGFCKHPFTQRYLGLLTPQSRLIHLDVGS